MFNRKIARKTATGADAAPALTLLESGSGNKTLLLGFRWQAIVTAGAVAKGAKALAQKAKATHIVVTPSVLGLGRLPDKGQTDSQISAAMLATQHARDGLFALRLPDERFWLCTVQGGKPTGIEHIVDSAGSAIESVSQAKEANSELVVYSDIPHLADVQLFTFADLILIVPLPIARVQYVNAQSFLTTLPKPLKMLGVLGVFGLLGWQVYLQEVDGEKATKSRQMQAQQEQQGIAAWNDLLAKEYGRRAVSLDIAVLHKSWLPLPMLLQGWSLQNAQCTSTFAGTASGVNKVWKCQAAYAAPEAASGREFAPNAQVNVPQGFAVEYQPPKGLKLSWSVTHSAKALTLKDLKASEHHLVHTASIIQQRIGVFKSVSDIRFGSVKLESPKRADGVAVPQPAGLVLPLEAPITLRAPLQAFDDVLPLLPVDWQSARLLVSEGADGHVMLEMSGVIYAK